MLAKVLLVAMRDICEVASRKCVTRSQQTAPSCLCSRACKFALPCVGVTPPFTSSGLVTNVLMPSVKPLSTILSFSDVICSTWLNEAAHSVPLACNSSRREGWRHRAPARPAGYRYEVGG